jgi:hypothetical protein
MNMTVIAGPDNDKVFTQTVKWSDFTIEMVKPKSAPQDAEFLVAKIRRKGVTWWEFRQYRSRCLGLAKLRMIGEEPIIVLATKDIVYQVVPIRDLPSALFDDNHEMVGGRDIKALISLKEEAARLLYARPSWTVREERMRNALEAAQRQAERRAVQEKHAKRDAVRTKLLSRKRLHVFLLEGARRAGIPVVGDEWMRLPNDTFCVSVKSYEENGVCGEPIEWFKVKKTAGGHTSRDKVSVVSNTGSEKQAQAAAPLRLKHVIVSLKGELEEAIEAPDMDFIRSLRDRNLNGGSLVVAPHEGKPGAFVGYRLVGGQIETVGAVMLP